ncbi:hypothetical protein ATANTOWER_026504 [Ataeniobius toweri]|uniref:Uncharacterized protein n=1 Tax=Ataeniobius toweri TaxID=208326 RepID=A0ABU7CL20_9TELE|nr:hypothetical protein [Ataeniobius toweri]
MAKSLPVFPGVHRHQISPDPNRTALGCGGTDDSRHGCSAHNSEATVRCYHVNMEQNLRSMFPHSVESIPRRTKAVLKDEEVPTRIQQGVPNAQTVSVLPIFSCSNVFLDF